MSKTAQRRGRTPPTANDLYDRRCAVFDSALGRLAPDGSW